MTETVKAYAKINLHLDVTKKREDGFHEVVTVMQTVSLFDIVTVTLTDDGEFKLFCDKEGVPTDDKNIALRAAKLFFEYTGLSFGAKIEIKKNIPMSAGLAGGSTDGAATLKALNSLCKNPLDREELSTLASRLGSDVPFCIDGGCSYCVGKGDILGTFPNIPDSTLFVVACGGEGVSTPVAYSMLDSLYENFENYTPRGTDSLRESLLSDTPESFSKYIFNIFEAPISEKRPVAKEIKEIMVKNGSVNAMMSGSGPSVFGIFEREKDAQNAVEKIKRMGCFACVCTPTKCD